MRSSVTIPQVPLSAAQQRDLRAVAAAMVPASAEFGVPGADDEHIFADLIASLGRDTPQVARALDRLADWARADAAGDATACFADLPVDHQERLTQRLRDEATPLALVLVNTVVRCYYRDDRVMRSLNMEPRPPFPKGFELEQGDWSLLEPVRARGRVYRETP